MDDGDNEKDTQSTASENNQNSQPLLNGQNTQNTKIEDDNLNLVDRIVKSKRENGYMKYYIKWLGYGNRENSCEPEEIIPQERIQEFHTRKHRKTHENNFSYFYYLISSMKFISGT